MKQAILIMDDDERRLNSMRALVAESCPDYDAILMYDAPHTIDWLKGHLSSAALISLDHDLGPNKNLDGKVFDPGSGMDVVDYLVTQDPVCPVIIHTTNYNARNRMIFALEASGWETAFAIPYGDLEWINDIWKTEVKRYLEARRKRL